MAETALDLQAELRSLMPTGRALTVAERFHAEQVGLLAADALDAAATRIAELEGERDRWRESSNRMTEWYEHRGKLLEQAYSHTNFKDQ